MRGYKEKGNINTPLELAMLNETDRFDLVIDVIDRVPRLRPTAAHLKEDMKNAIIDNLAYAHEQGRDREEISRLGLASLGQRSSVRARHGKAPVGLLTTVAEDINRQARTARYDSRTLHREVSGHGFP